MAEEREVLLKNAFPELQRFCRERGVFLTAVSFRKKKLLLLLWLHLRKQRQRG
jgi:hypothetical protein